ncbi:MAG: hypothetical protein DRI44_08700, partial [Chlamydiae bacterium]
MKTNALNLFIIILVLSFLFGAKKISAESQNIKLGEIPTGLDASSWQKIQKQIQSLQPHNEQSPINPIIQDSKGISPLAPLSGSEIKLTASDAQAYDYFGYSVAVAGDVAVVGAEEEDAGGNKAGAAYIFERNYGGTNNWGEVKKLVALDAQADDKFGYSVTVAGDVIVVGSPYEDAGGNNAGAAYIFERNYGGINNWGQVKKIASSDLEANDIFGISVAVAGDVLVVGAISESTGATRAGAAYIFERDSGGANNWGQVKKLVASTPMEDAYFGMAVSIAGDVAVVGAYMENAIVSYSGAAYIFERNYGGVNAWGQVKKVAETNTYYFGNAVSVDGDVAVVGAWNTPEGGAVFIYERNFHGTNNWGKVKKIVASDAEPSDRFGSSVSVNGDIIVIGAYLEDSGGSQSGAAYIFKRNAGGTNSWDETKKIAASNGQANDVFGYSVGIEGDIIIIGAIGDDSGGTSAGAAYIIPASTETKEFSEVAKKTHVGSVASVAGDVAVVGMYWGDDYGTAYVFERNAGGINNWGQVKKLIPSDGEWSDQFGQSVAVDGDVIIVGMTDSTVSKHGSAYIFERNYGGINNWGQTKKLLASDSHTGNLFGKSVDIDGNVAVIGAQYDNAGGSISGAAYVFERNYGGINTWGQVKKLNASDASSDAQFGKSVAVNGDVIAVGAPFNDNYGYDSGLTYIYERNSGGINNWGETKKLIASDIKATNEFGYSVAVDGDVVLIGRPGNESAAYIYERNFGGINVWGEVKKLTVSVNNASLGYSVSIFGDVAVIGAPYDGLGSVYVYERNADGVNAWGKVQKITVSDAFGSNVSVDGDVMVAIARNSSDAYIFEQFITPPPRINNANGATDITENSATLRGEVTYTGGENPVAAIAWGDNDAGTSTGSWDHFINMGIQTGNFSSTITGLQQNTKYYYRCYATNSGGVAWANYTTNFTTFGFPFIDISNASPININYDTETYQISGTNLNIAGQLTYINDQHPTSTNYFAPGFSVAISNINYGDNLITVFGTNVSGMITNDFVTIHRETFEEIYPFIKITNAPTEVAYNISSAEISGTNLNIAGQLGWTNTLTGGIGTVPISNFQFQVSVDHGDNLITIFGTNIYGQSTNDVVSIHRETFAEVHPFIDITNVDHIIAYNISSAEISGTNLNIAGEMWWTNSLSGGTGLIQVSGVRFQVSGIPVDYGDNLITVFGTNIYGQSTNDVVSIHRETWDEVHPFIDITNVDHI